MSARDIKTLIRSKTTMSSNHTQLITSRLRGEQHVRANYNINQEFFE